MLMAVIVETFYLSGTLYHGMASLREGMCQHSGRGAGFPEVGHSVDSILLVNNSN